jgi:Rrf2 family iron-sulfur cluster assembly transcriptional regulator
MRFNRAVEYGIEGLTVLARRGRERTTMLRDVSKATSISETFLSKIFQKLVRSGLVRSRRGFRGGFLLARPASQITLREVIEALQGPISFPRRPEGAGDGTRTGTAGGYLHQVLERAQARVRAALEETTVADLVRSGFPTSREKLV